MQIGFAQVGHGFEPLPRICDPVAIERHLRMRHFQQPPTGNLTGTMQAFRPDGALGSGKLRPASTGDYEPWIPE